MHRRIPPTLLALSLLWPVTTTAQSVWSETTVTVEPVHGMAPLTDVRQEEGPTVIAPGDEGTTSTPAALPGITESADNLPGPLDYDELLALNQRAADATVQVRATIPQGPLIAPPERVVEGAAVFVQDANGRSRLVTTFGLIDGASRVELEWHGQEIVAVPVADARYGLALLEPERPLANPPAPLPLLHVEANEPVQLFSPVQGSAGAALGAGESQYGFYQVNTVAVTLGYPLINRRGELAGIGSHRYPVDPRLTLSVPGAQVEAFLESLE